MNFPDFAARGMAKKALAFDAELGGAGGSAAIGRRRTEAEAILEPVQSILDRIDLSPASFGTLAIEDGSDKAGLQAFVSALGAAGAGIRSLDAKRYTMGNGGVQDALYWDQSNSGLIGRGMGRTILDNTNANANFAMVFSGSSENTYFSDMTFNGRVLVGGFGANTIKNVIFNRCLFRSNLAQSMNGIQFNCGGMTDGLYRVWFIDCVFGPNARMGCEITAQANDGTTRAADIHFIRPRFFDNALFALSLAGRLTTVTVDQPYFDGNAGTCIENAGCDDLIVRDALARASNFSATGAAYVASAVNATYNSNARSLIDGWKFLPERSSTGRPAVPGRANKGLFQIEAGEDTTLRRIDARLDCSINQGSIIQVQDGGLDGQGVRRTARRVIVENCDLESNAANYGIVNLTNVGGQSVVRNSRIINTNGARLGGLISAFDNNSGLSGELAVRQNDFDGNAVTSAQRAFLVKTGAGKLAADEQNNGLPTRFRQVVTIPASATSSALVSHGLPNVTSRMSAKPLGNLNGATFPFTTAHSSATQIRANVSTPPTASISVEIEIEIFY